MDQLLTKVKDRLVLFDEAPSLELARRGAPREYWLIIGGAVTHRVYRNKNIIEDLYQVFEHGSSDGQLPIYVHMTPHTEEERAAETVHTDEPGPNIKAACCHYDLQTRELVELYPSENAAARGLGISYHAVHACNWGNIAVLHGSVVTTTHYLAPYELELRRLATERSNPCRPRRVYVYDYTGEAIGVFTSMLSAARGLGVDYRAIRRGTLSQDRPQRGYYFSLDPGYRPPVIGADGLLQGGACQDDLL